ncbi:MAG: NUDIX domain-containing protein [Candidatus Taylorbacteria bacterium]
MNNTASKKKIRNRATAVIYKDEKLLLFRRVKPNAEYFVFPGGGVNDGETVEDALHREVEEELTLKIINYKHLLSINNLKIDNVAINYPTEDQDHHYYLVTDFHGIPELGGSEKESANESNQYHIEWFTFDELKNVENIYPRNIAGMLKQKILQTELCA